MASFYRKFLRLLESWPGDKSKLDRDLGWYLREQVKINFAQGGVTANSSEEECERIYNSLKRLSDNHYRELHKRHSKSSATGLTAEQCNSVLSSEFLEELKKKDQSIIKKIFKT